MAHMIKKQSSVCGRPPPSMGLQKNSRVISKVQPKIRIIHIFAPEIIKTDVANFRELVQRLTGKPSENTSGTGGAKATKGKRSRATEDQPRSSSDVHDKAAVSNKVVHDHYHHGAHHNHNHNHDNHHHHHHQELWRGESSGGFLNAFADVDCFMQEIGVGVGVGAGEFPSFVSPGGNAFEETQTFL